MIVHGLTLRVRKAPRRPDPFAGPLRHALAEARKRRTPVTLPTVRALEAWPREPQQEARRA